MAADCYPKRNGTSQRHKQTVFLLGLIFCEYRAFTKAAGGFKGDPCDQEETFFKTKNGTWVKYKICNPAIALSVVITGDTS